MRQITFAPTFTEWQKFARRALADGSPPHELVWEELHDDQPALGMFAEAGESTPLPKASFRVPRAFVDLAKRVACHRDAERWALLYRVLWRLTHGEPHLMEVSVDPDVHRLQRMDKAIRHDVHKMRAFARWNMAGRRGMSRGSSPSMPSWNATLRSFATALPG